MSKKYNKITVLENSITITPDDFISDWLRNKNTVEYLAIWERMHKANFNYGEYATIRNQAAFQRF